MRIIVVFFQLLIVLAGCGRNSGLNNNGLKQDRIVTTQGGMVVSAHPESSRTGALILLKGGNAIDAAVATEFALAVCYPEAGNLGGGGFMVIRKNDGSAFVIDYREKAPAASSEEMFLDNDGNVMPGSSTSTHLASGVPGTVAGMIKAHSMFGRLPFREVIQPAIDLAAKGYPLPERQAQSLNSNRKNFSERNRTLPSFVKEGWWMAGDTLVQPELAATLERIRDYGADGFYKGITARLIVEEMGRGNGIITLADLGDYSATLRDPLTSAYRNLKIITVPPPSGGGITLIQLLKMTSEKKLGSLGLHTPAEVHLVCEAEKRAFADRAHYAGDPAFTRVPVSTLTDSDYLAYRMSDYSDNQATPSDKIRHGEIAGYESEETTHYSVVDHDGNSVSATTTLNGCGKRRRQHRTRGCAQALSRQRHRLRGRPRADRRPRHNPRGKYQGDPARWADTRSNPCRT